MDLFRKRFSGYSSIKVIIAVILGLLIINDTGTTAAIRWLAVVFSVSFFMRPYIAVRKLSYFDSGFGMSFGAGLFLCFYSAWVISSTGICRFSDAIVFASFLILSVLGYVIRKYVVKEAYVTSDEFKHFLNGFAIFAVIFLAVFWVIGFNPLVDPGTENYMDFGFMQGIYRQKSAIPEDIWFSGTKLNYYYLGQAVSVYMCRLSLTTPEYGYNMMLATFAGMVFVMSAELVSAVAGALIADGPEKKKCVTTGSMLGGALAAFGANGHWLLYGIFIPLYRKISGATNLKNYWFADPTVFINTDFGDLDNGKNEFPAYSFILGDLHAHVINVMFVLPLVGILFDLVLSDDDKDRERSKVWRLVLISLLLAYCKGANYWDFAIYYVITGALIVFTQIKRYGLSKKAVVRIASAAAIVTAVSYIAILPFTVNFVKMESGIGICTVHSPIYKLMVLWAMPVAITVWLICVLYRKKEANHDVDSMTRCALLPFMLCVIGLIIVPEFIYVKDIYGDLNQRFNTMFKLTYQAYILFAVITGIAFVYMLYMADTAGRFLLVATVLCCLTLLCTSYSYRSVKQWFGNVFDPSRRRGISSIEGLREDDVYGFEMVAYDILAEDEREHIHVIEAAGDSYSHYNALSVYSGACTPIGWFVHEWMWHNDPEPVRERADEVSHFYSCDDEQYCREFLKKYDADYILVGPAEVCKYPVYRTGFARFGDVVVNTMWQGVELDLIRVDKSRL